MEVSIKLKMENCHMPDSLQLVSENGSFVARPFTEADTMNCSFAASVPQQDMDGGTMTVGL